MVAVTEMKTFTFGCRHEEESFSQEITFLIKDRNIVYSFRQAVCGNLYLIPGTPDRRVGERRVQKFFGPAPLEGK